MDRESFLLVLSLNSEDFLVLLEKGDHFLAVVGIRGEFGEPVVDIAVDRLIGAHREQHVSHRGLWPELVVVDGDLWGLHVFPTWQLAVVQLLNKHGVSVDRLFLQEAHQAVAEPRGDQVAKEVEIPEDDLR